jgi:hypothetical protein
MAKAFARMYGAGNATDRAAWPRLLDVFLCILCKLRENLRRRLRHLDCGPRHDCKSPIDCAARLGVPAALQGFPRFPPLCALILPVSHLLCKMPARV